MLQMKVVHVFKGRLAAVVACLLSVMLGAVSAEAAVAVVHEAVGDTAAGLYDVEDEAAFREEKGLQEGQYALLSEEELAALGRGETLLISERMPMLKGLHTAWGIAFSSATSEELFDLTLDYESYPKHFSDVLELEPWRSEDDSVHMVYILKDAAMDVEMVLRYRSQPPNVKEWFKATEEDVAEMRPEDREAIRARMEDDDFKANTGAWYFIDSEHPALGEHQAVIVRSVAVKLSGFISLLKGPKAIKRSTEKEMPYTMEQMVKLASQAKAAE